MTQISSLLGLFSADRVPGSLVRAFRLAMGKAAKAKAKAKAKGKAKPKAKEGAKKGSEKPVIIPATTMECFDFMALARKLAAEVKDGTKPGENLAWASGCDGLNTIAAVLEALGVPNHQVCGAEKAAGPAVFSLKRFAPGHLYQDRRSICVSKI